MRTEELEREVVGRDAEEKIELKREYKIEDISRNESDKKSGHGLAVRTAASHAAGRGFDPHCPYSF